MAKFLSLLCFILLGIDTFAQNKDQDIAAAKELQVKFDYKTAIVCQNAVTTVTFDTIGGSPKATMETKEQFICLKDEYTFLNVLGSDDFTNVSDVRVYDDKDKPLFTTVIDQSNEGGEDFYSDERVRAFQIYFPSFGNKRSYDELTLINDLKYLNEVFLINSYPILNDTVIFKVPAWLNIDFKETNFEGYDIKKSVTTDAKNNLTIYTYLVKNMPAAHFDERDVPGNSFMFPNILVMCKNYTKAGGNVTPVLSSVNDLYQWYEKLVNETGNNDETLKPLVNEITKGKTTNWDKAKAIYYWVEDNIRYVAFENGIVGYKPAACQTVVSNKYGDCKCMANLLTEMLKLAGLDARRAWLGTKGIAYDLSTPSLAAHNHAICVLVLNGKNYYLDATEEYANLGYDNDFIQGREILFENGNSFAREHIPVASIASNKADIHKTLTLNGDMITGNAAYTYNGDSKTEILWGYNHMPSNERENGMKYFISHRDANINLLSSKISDMQNRDIPVSIDYNFTIKNQVTQFDKDTYVSIDYDKVLENMEFDSTRHNDYQFDFRLNYNVNDTLVIPTGYATKHLPDNLNITTPDYAFNITISQTADKIIYHKEIQVFNNIIRKKDFKTWNAAVKQLKNIYDDQIILTKP